MSEEEIRRLEAKAKIMWNLSLEVAENQLENGDYFAIEHPAYTRSWKTRRAGRIMKRPEVASIIFDQCAFGLQVAKTGGLSEKSARIIANSPHLAAALAEAQCSCQSLHAVLEGGLPAKAQVYPDAMCEVLAESARRTMSRQRFISAGKDRLTARSGC